MNQEVFDDVQRRLRPGIMAPESTTGIHWFLYGLARLTQPRRIVEVGTCKGDATIYLVRAAVDNGRGSVRGYEVDPEKADATRAKVAAAFGDGAPYEQMGGFPYDASSPVEADLAFIDVDPKTDYGRALDGISLSVGGYVCAHDLTYPPSRAHVEAFHEQLLESGRYEAIAVQQERGLTVARKTAGGNL